MTICQNSWDVSITVLAPNKIDNGKRSIFFVSTGKKLGFRLNPKFPRLSTKIKTTPSPLFPPKLLLTTTKICSMVPQMKWDLFPKICSSFLLLLCLYNIISLLGPMQIFVVTVSLHEQFAKKKNYLPPQSYST